MNTLNGKPLGWNLPTCIVVFFVYDVTENWYGSMNGPPARTDSIMECENAE